MRCMIAKKAKGPLEQSDLDLGQLGPDEVDIAVTHCGVCHSDLSMISNDWQMTEYPFVPGHEAVGRISAVGPNVKTRKVGDLVGLGWFSRSCLNCDQCLSGSHNLCRTGQGTIIRRPGAFATHVRCQEMWAIPLPQGLDPKKAGPLFCGGITVFNPIIQCRVLPTERVGVIGIGGLGHLALQFLRAWGCEVTAFSSNTSKTEEMKKLGAHNVVTTKDKDAIGKLSGKLDFIISTVNVPLEWEQFISCLGPKGRFHVVGAVLEPMPISALQLISGAKSVSGSPVGSAGTVIQMLDFAARHRIEPQTEFYPMSKANDALEHLVAGKARYRIVLENDLH